MSVLSQDYSKTVRVNDGADGAWKLNLERIPFIDLTQKQRIPQFLISNKRIGHFYFIVKSFCYIGGNGCGFPFHLFEFSEVISANLRLHENISEQEVFFTLTCNVKKTVVLC